MRRDHLQKLVECALECIGKEAKEADIASLLVDAAYHVVRDRLDEMTAPMRSVRRIRDIVQADYKLTDNDMTSRRRDTDEARQLVMWIARQTTDKSLPQIGRILDRDHTTIMHGMRQIQRRVDTDPAFAARVSRIVSVVSQTSHP